jgi:hypothetical protein
MPLENRVGPDGIIFRTPARGTFLGNRGGALHNDSREIVRQFKDRRWLICVLEFKGRRRAVMAPGRYTELFFLDEATAFAAGHRPCAECRRDRFNAFKAAWARRTGAGSGELLRASEIDAQLHPARIGGGGAKITWQAALDLLPDGCFIQIDGSPWLVWKDGLLLWTPQGYARREARPNRRSVTVLTPRPIVECFRLGYEPEIHASARAVVAAV